VFSQVRPLSLEDAKENAVNPFLVKDFERHYDVSISRIISLNSEDEVVVYQFIPYRELSGRNRLMLSGQLYVRTKDRAIVRMEAFTQYIGIIGGLSNVIDGKFDFTVTYRDGIESYPIVESVNVETVVAFLRNEQPHQMNIYSILYAIDQPIETRRRARTMRQSDNLLRIVANSRHNQAFWDNNPFIKRTQVEQRVLDDFNRLGYFGSMNLSE
jgi:hypothetical protein